ncbi:hypothetical protein [Undibacterium sp. TS12]|uniref:hypothetical protein n=1 Tax=Undibacterium sp. TS12 TaxID=2908202 RepID=UPI001F4D0A85|nr:hypothetical protein [Undibacterium sp. TS12]MCH8618724.1 hypothetical protein [Undibacterium sp. TS12]
MKKLFRLFLLCIMFVAIPFQGFAAAAMVGCNTEHHHALPGEPHDHDNAQARQHDHQHIDADKVSDHVVAKVSPTAKSMKDKCSACASCCVGAALVTDSTVPPVSALSSEKISLVFSSHFGHISDGLERPPRA